MSSTKTEEQSGTRGPRTNGPETVPEKIVTLAVLSLVPVTAAFFFLLSYQHLHAAIPTPPEMKWLVDLSMIITFWLVGIYMPKEAYHGNLE